MSDAFEVAHMATEAAGDAETARENARRSASEAEEAAATADAERQASQEAALGAQTEAERAAFFWQYACLAVILTHQQAAWATQQALSWPPQPSRQRPMQLVLRQRPSQERRSELGRPINAITTDNELTLPGSRR